MKVRGAYQMEQNNYGINSSDELTVDPISRERMDMLWMDAEELEVLQIAVEGKHEVFIGPEKGGSRKLTVTREDVEWAKSVDRIAAKAAKASSRHDFITAIKYYKEALKLAPGADIYLMSIGSCYANMQQLQEALLYLNRAHEISPNNRRVSKNLRVLEMTLNR